MKKKSNHNSKGQFTVGNKAAEKWTEAEALKLGEELIEWMKADPGKNWLIGHFLANKRLYKDVLTYLSEKYEPFSALKKEADQMQENAAIVLGCKGNAAMPIFMLKNHHGYSDKIEQKHDIKQHNSDRINIEICERKKK